MLASHGLVLGHPAVAGRDSVELPVHQDLLSQAQGALVHPFTQGLRLWAFVAWCGEHHIDT